MKIYAEIYNRCSSKYWKRGIFVLRNVGGGHYWYPFHELAINDTSEDFDISCVLEKSDSENCEIINYEKGTPRGHGYEFKPGDLALPEAK